MKKHNNQYVLSASEFHTISDAENKVNDWYEKGTLNKKGTRLYRVVDIYDLKLKFIKRKNE